MSSQAKPKMEDQSGQVEMGKFLPSRTGGKRAAKTYYSTHDNKQRPRKRMISQVKHPRCQNNLTNLEEGAVGLLRMDMSLNQLVSQGPMRIARKRMRQDCGDESQQHRHNNHGKPASSTTIDKINHSTKGAKPRLSRLKQKSKQNNGISIAGKPIEALAKKALHSVLETSPWTSEVMLGLDEEILRDSPKEKRSISGTQRHPDRQQQQQQQGNDISYDRQSSKLNTRVADSTSIDDSDITGNTNPIIETKPSDNKRTIATCLRQNFYNKNLKWQTNLIMDSETGSDSDSAGDLETIFGQSDDQKDLEQVDDEKGDKLWECSSIKTNNELILSDCRTTVGALALSSKGDLLTCATAAVMVNFSSPDEQLDGGYKNMPKHDFPDRRPGSSNYNRALFNYASFSNQSSETTTSGKPSVNFSEPFEDASDSASKANLTRRLADQTSSLHLSIDNLRLMAERNLVATLVGVYILVSLTVIMVLILPYLFNLPRTKTIDDGENSDFDKFSSSSFEHTKFTSHRFEKHYQTYKNPQTGSHSSPEIGNSPNSIDKKFNLADSIAPAKSGNSQVVDRKLNVIRKSSTKIVSKDENEKLSSADNGSAGVISGYQDPAINLSVREEGKNDAQNETLGLELIASRQDAQGNKKRVVSRPNQPPPTQKPTPKGAISEPTFKQNNNNKYYDLWKVTHDQKCQPLMVPFCSKSFGSMLTGFGISGQQTAEPMSYDKTLLPNQFSQSQQSHIERVLRRYEPIVDIKCFALMPLFLCSIYAPKCIQINQTQDAGEKAPFIDQSLSLVVGDDTKGGYDNSQHVTNPSDPSIGSSQPKKASDKFSARLVPPCRSLCRDAFRKCMFFFEVLSLKLLEPEDCESLPESHDPNVCIGQQERSWLRNATESQSCQADKFRCTDGECIPKKWRCDGFADCTDKIDEDKCSKCNVDTQFYCGQDICISKSQVCNGIGDCRDGRDERQCCTQKHVDGPRQLEVWSALKDTWIPACGAHWSAMPMSQQACQALGYSRVNETLIVLGSDKADPRFHMHPNISSLSLDGLQQKIILSMPVINSSLSLYHDGSKLNQRSSGAWFDAPQGDSNIEADLDSIKDNVQMVDIVKDMAAVDSSAKGLKLSRPGQSDHLVVYESRLGPTGDSGLRASEDLASIDVAEIKLKSLTAMLYHGPEAGCIGKPLDKISTVYLQCQNFQCGRSITSYSTRMNLLQPRPTIPAVNGIARKLDSVPLKARSDLIVEPFERDVNDHDTVRLNPFGQPRIQTSEANEELNTLYDDTEIDDVDQFDVDQHQQTGIDIGDKSRLLDEIIRQHHGQQNRQPKSVVNPRFVVGGIESMPGEFPYLAALHGGPDEVFFCGGVLIGVNWLLTAAHCVGNRTQPDGWMVKVGVTRRIASPAFVKKLKVRMIIKHPNFNRDSLFNNDIALILLEESVEFNQYLRPICLPRANLKLGPDNSKDCVVVGFGKSIFSQEANYLHVAHFVNVPIVHHSICSGWYSDHGINLTEGMLCAGYAEGKRDACQGDSGSGLFCRYSNTNQFFVAGVVSFGIKCATPKLPGVYTSVPSYVDWIEKTTRQHGYQLG